jgi:hypothetical protein
MYGFKSGQNKKTIAINRMLAEDLKEGSVFAFKVCRHYGHDLVLIQLRISRLRRAYTSTPSLRALSTRCGLPTLKEYEEGSTTDDPSDAEE